MANHPADRPLSDTETAANAQAKHFGALVRERREALKMRQDDLALATGVGRRFILELEAGKQSCQLGRSLVVAAAVGLRPFDLMNANSDDDNALLPDLADDVLGDLPDLPDDDRG
jgi:transcriptional regulator with XRE-family HTH domain